MTSSFSHVTQIAFYIMLLVINDRWRFQMKKVIQSKTAAVLIFNYVFWSFFTGESLLTEVCDGNNIDYRSL